MVPLPSGTGPRSRRVPGPGLGFAPAHSRVLAPVRFSRAELQLLLCGLTLLPPAGTYKQIYRLHLAPALLDFRSEAPWDLWPRGARGARLHVPERGQGAGTVPGPAATAALPGTATHLLRGSRPQVPARVHTQSRCWIRKLLEHGAPAGVGYWASQTGLT